MVFKNGTLQKRIFCFMRTSVCAAFFFASVVFCNTNLNTAFAQSDDDFDFVPSLPTAGNVAEEEADFEFEKTPEELEEELRREAFDAALEGIMPLRPGEIRELLTYYDKTQEAVNTPINPPPRPDVTVETVSLDPGAEPVTVKVAYGYVTTLNILDSTGAPWPIEDMTWAGNFEIIEVTGGDGAAHFVRIAPQSEYARGNISIHMLGLQTPVIISLDTSKDVVHYRFDAIIPEAGPLAKAPIIDMGIATVAGDIKMTGILEGVVPSGARRLDVSGVDGRTTAYRMNNMTYVRTPMSLLSPAWISSASSADGMRVYALNNAPVLLFSDKGKMVRVRLSDRESLFDGG